MPAEKIDPRYESHGDAVTRLNGCILMYRGVPVHLADTGDPMMFRPIWLDKKDVPAEMLENWPHSINVSTDPELDLCLPTLGYCNDKTLKANTWDPAFVSRLSVRRYQQGLNPRNCVAARERDGGRVGSHGDGRILGVANQAISKVLLNKYPTWETAYRTVLEKDHHGLAFSRVFCLSKTEAQPEVIRLRYMTRTFGLMDANKQRPVINVLPEFRKFTFLVKDLTEKGVELT